MSISFIFALLFVQYTFYYSLWDFVVLVVLCFTTRMYQREGFLLMMQVEIEQWRAGMECSLASVRRLFPLSKAVMTIVKCRICLFCIRPSPVTFLAFIRSCAAICRERGRCFC